MRSKTAFERRQITNPFCTSADSNVGSCGRVDVCPAKSRVSGAHPGMCVHSKTICNMLGFSRYRGSLLPVPERSTVSAYRDSAGGSVNIVHFGEFASARRLCTVLGTYHQECAKNIPQCIRHVPLETRRHGSSRFSRMPVLAITWTLYANRLLRKIYINQCITLIPRYIALQQPNAKCKPIGFVRFFGMPLA